MKQLRLVEVPPLRWIRLHRETAGYYVGGPKLRFHVKRASQKYWIVIDKLTSRMDRVKRLKDARNICTLVLAIEAKTTPPKKKKKGGPRAL